MSDRLVVYKTPLHRFLETFLILLVTAALSALGRMTLPTIALGFVILAAFALAVALVPPLGTRFAEWRGAARMTRERRSRRYLDELIPMSLGAYPAQGGASRRIGARTARRG